MENKGILSNVTQVFFHIVLTGFCLLTTLPFILIFMVSISDENSVIKNGYKFFPDKFSLDAYKMVLSGNNIFSAYKISIIVTVIGTVLALVICSMAAFTLSIQKVKYRNIIAMFFFITMLFNAGLVPSYILITKYLHLKNNILVLILPLLVNVYNVFLLRNYFKSLPPALVESAEIEGASPLYVFLKIIIPLSTPIMATVALFVSLQYWNDWGTALWYIDNPDLYPLQFMLYKIQSLINFMKANLGNSTGGGVTAVPKETIQTATVLLTIGPIILVYPFVQKYFIKGIMIGAVKG